MIKKKNEISCIVLSNTIWRTLFAEFSEEAEVGDGWPGEDDGVLSGDVLAELLGHQAVELRLVLESSQSVCALPLLQMHRDLQQPKREVRFYFLQSHGWIIGLND